MSDKTRRAIGIKYSPGEGNSKDNKKAPNVVSKGVGDLADQIIAAAEEAGVLIHEDEQLNEFLAKFSIGDEIPPAVYTVMAELIAYSYYLQGITPDGWPDSKA